MSQRERITESGTDDPNLFNQRERVSFDNGARIKRAWVELCISGYR